MFKCRRKGHLANVGKTVHAIDEDGSDTETLDNLALDAIRRQRLRGVERQAGNLVVRLVRW